MFDVAEISELQSKVLIRLIDDDKDFGSVQSKY